MSDVLIGSAGAAVLSRRLAAVPDEAQKTTRAALRDVGGDVLADARANASWSSRIPGSLVLQVRFASRFPGVVVAARAGVAPHARPYEGIGGNASFNHPVFGDRAVWVAQGTRPFLRPAVASAGPGLSAAMVRAVDAAAKSAGL